MSFDKLAVLVMFIVFLHGSHTHSERNETGEYPNPADDDDSNHGPNDEMEREKTHTHNHHRHRQDSVEISRLQLFEQTDTDGDGFVTRREYAAYNNIPDDVTTDVDDLFVTYDRDNDGKLSEQEFVDQSSPWEIIDECEFQVMQKCQAEFDQSMNEADSDLDEPLCRGLQAALDCVMMSGKETEESCDIESYILSVKQVAMVYRSSGLCPNLDVGISDFEIEIHYGDPKDEISAEYEYEEDIESDFSSDSISESQVRPGRSLADDKAGDISFDGLPNGLHIPVVDRACSSQLLVPCDNEFETAINKDMDTKLTLGRYRACVLETARNCGNERQNLLIREGLKIIAKKHRAVLQNELTKDILQKP